MTDFHFQNNKSNDFLLPHGESQRKGSSANFQKAQNESHWNGSKLDQYFSQSPRFEEIRKQIQSSCSSSQNSQQSGSPQKIIICRTDLIQFINGIARQKKQGQEKLKRQTQQILYLQNQLQELGQALASASPQLSLSTTAASTPANIKAKLQQQITQLKGKLFQEKHMREKLQSRIKQITEGQIQSLKNQISMLQSKLKYQHEQTTRYQEFLMIKEEIIKNLQWERERERERQSQKQREREREKQHFLITKANNVKVNSNSNHNSFLAFNNSINNNKTIHCGNKVMARIEQSLDLSEIIPSPSHQFQSHQHQQEMISTLLKPIDMQMIMEPSSSSHQQQNKPAATAKHIAALRHKGLESRSRSSSSFQSNAQSSHSLYSNNLHRTKSDQNVYLSIEALKRLIKTKDQEIQNLHTTIKQFNQKEREREGGSGSRQHVFSSSQSRHFKKPLANGSDDRKIILLKQKCQILQSQIESLTKKIIALEQLNKQYVQAQFIQRNNQKGDRNDNNGNGNNNGMKVNHNMVSSSSKGSNFSQFVVGGGEKQRAPGNASNTVGNWQSNKQSSAKDYQFGQQTKHINNNNDLITPQFKNVKFDVKSKYFPKMPVSQSFQAPNANHQYANNDKNYSQQQPYHNGYYLNGNSIKKKNQEYSTVHQKSQSSIAFQGRFLE